MGATTPFVMMQTISSLYRVPHCDYRTRAIYSNNPYAGSFGYGNLQKRPSPSRRIWIGWPKRSAWTCSISG
ncbi:MAG: hypothetical protein R3D52_02145 [Xanthobacteraceae bacterium]